MPDRCGSSWPNKSISLNAVIHHSTHYSHIAPISTKYPEIKFNEEAEKIGFAVGAVLKLTNFPMALLLLQHINLILFQNSQHLNRSLSCALASANRSAQFNVFVGFYPCVYRTLERDAKHYLC